MWQPLRQKIFHTMDKRKSIFNHHHNSPSLPQPSAGQSKSTGCQNWAPVVELRTQARFSQCESEHWPQQQCSPMCLYLQSSPSRFVQGLPGEAWLHSDKKIWLVEDIRYQISESLQTWCNRCPAETPADVYKKVDRAEKYIHFVTSGGYDWWQEVVWIRWI